jgi:hypothetical protein
MDVEQRVKALRRRVNSERRAAGDQRVRFSKKLREDVVAALKTTGWSRTRSNYPATTTCSGRQLAANQCRRWASVTTS